MLVADVVGGTPDTLLTGVVYDDLDANGVRSDGENGLSGWTVFLDLDNSGTRNRDAAGTLEPASVTDQDGTFLLTHLRPGTYRVAEVAAAGWRPTTPLFKDIAVAMNKEAKTDFFNFGAGAIGGVVWSDLDGDGLRDVDVLSGDTNEPCLPGWTIFLDLDNDRSLGPLEPSTVTDDFGRYAFKDLPAGDYEVTEVLPDGWDVTRGHDIRQTVSVVALGSFTQEFGNASSTNGSLQGAVWNDANIDGVRAIDPATGDYLEPGLSGWTVFLDLNRDGVPSLDVLGTTLEPTTVTTAAGRYTFTNLTAGDYEATLLLPAGWDTSPLFDLHQTVTVRAGMPSSGNDFAAFTALNGGIRGTVWNDANRNGVRDLAATGAPIELGLAGWTVFLDRNGDGLLGGGEPTATSDTAGAYAFADLQVGTYEVREILPAGWETATGFADSVSVRVYSGTDAVAPDFANVDATAAVPAKASGVVWFDADGDGIRGPGEAGIAGRVVFVDVDGDGTPGATEPTTSSTADGSYTLAGLTPGSLTIVAAAAPGWRATAPPSRVRLLAVKNGDSLTGVDFGFTPVRDASLEGRVYRDANANGVCDAGEGGLAGITVFLDANRNGSLDADESSTVTSGDFFYTPSVDEAGDWSFAALGSGTCEIRFLLPAALSATPSSQILRTVSLGAGESRSGILVGAVARPTEIRGTAFDDVDGDHIRGPGEPGHAGATVFIDRDRDDMRDADEPIATTSSDGSYVFSGLPPGAYVIREDLAVGRQPTSPVSIGSVLWPSGTSNPSIGAVTPTNITASLATGAPLRRSVSLTLPGSGALTNLVDVFLLFDDTGSFVNNSPIVRGAFPTIMTELLASLPGIDLGFGVGRFEEYAGFAAEYATGRPFVLNQPIVAASTPGSVTAIQAALDRTTPGYGGDQPETDIEALYQLVTGAGFDGNGNGTSLDSGPAGRTTTQLAPGASGDVPPFASFQADSVGHVLPASGSVGGGGFRAGALPVILLATDTGFAYQPKGEASITGANGVSLPISSLIGTSRSATPRSAGAGIQETVTALNALGGFVIGLGTNPQPTMAPRQGLEALSTLTGAVNRSTTTIANGTSDPIAPGDPLYFQIASGFAASVAAGVVNAIRNAVTSVAVDITVQASDPHVRVVNHTGTARGLGAGQTATFDIEFTGDGVPRRFDLQFVRAGTGVVLGSIPVVLGTPIAGDCFDFEELEDGEHSADHDFGSRSFTGPSDDVVSVGSGIDETDATPHAGNVRLVKRGAGILVIAIANSHSGGTVVEDGKLVVRNAGGLGSGGLVVRANATVACDVATAEVNLPSLTLDVGAKFDVGAGRVRVASGGYGPSDVVGLLRAGHAGGWASGSGILSSVAALAASRGVGYVLNDDGSITVAYAAPGDTNLDGVLDLLDASNFVAAATYDSAVAADWAHGDFNYDGIVDLLDAADFIGAGMFDVGSYLPVAGPVAVVTADLSPWEMVFASFATNEAPRKGRLRRGGVLTG